MRATLQLCLLLQVEAFRSSVVCPNKHLDGDDKLYRGRLLASETYIGGKVEAIESGVFRADIPCDFKLQPEGYQLLLDRCARTNCGRHRCTCMAASVLRVIVIVVQFSFWCAARNRQPVNVTDAVLPATSTMLQGEQRQLTWGAISASAATSSTLHASADRSMRGRAQQPAHKQRKWAAPLAARFQKRNPVHKVHAQWHGNTNHTRAARAPRF